MLAIIMTTRQMKKVTCGVPRVSALGPLLFLIYISDLPRFADNTNLFSENKDISVLLSTVNRDLQNINEWFISNKLSLNVKKRNFLFFIKLVGEMIYHLSYQSLIIK